MQMRRVTSLAKKNKDKKLKDTDSESAGESHASDSAMFSSAVKQANEILIDAQNELWNNGCAFTLNRSALVPKEDKAAATLKSNCIEKGAFELT